MIACHVVIINAGTKPITISLTALQRTHGEYAYCVRDCQSNQLPKRMVNVHIGIRLFVHAHVIAIFNK